MLNGLPPYKLIYKAFRFGGLMNEEGRPWSLLYTLFIVCMLNLVGLSSVLELLLGSGKLRELILAFSAFSIYIYTNVKAIRVIPNETRIRNLLNRMEQYRLEMLEEENGADHILKADSFGAKIVTYFYALFFCLPFYSFIINYIVDSSNQFETPHLTIQVWIPWRLNEFWPYILGNIVIVLFLLTFVLVYLSCCTMEFIFTFQLSAYLKILQKRLETKGPSDKNIYRHHQQLILFVREFNKLFSGHMYVEVFASSLQPCGFGYALIKSIKRSEFGTTFDMAYKLFMTFLCPFVLCACGQEISNQMEKLHESAYMSNWYEEKPNVRRNLYTMMLVTVRPMTLNYRLLVVINFVCFSKIVQGVYSYLTMLINVENK